MIRFGSLQKDYDFYVSCDPAFIKAPVAPPDDASEPDRAAYTKAMDDYIAKWKTARETTNYLGVLVEGQTPAKFVLGRVNRKAWRAIQDLASERRVGPSTVYSLLARLSVRSIPALEMKLDHTPDPQWNGWEMAPQEMVEKLDDHDASIVGEIGIEVLRRLNLTQGDSPS